MNQGPQQAAGGLREFVARVLPPVSLLHSLLVDLRWTPGVGEDPRLVAFTDTADHELHHLIGLWGALLRMGMGDPAAPSSMGLNAARFLLRRTALNQQVRELPVGAGVDPRFDTIAGLVDASNREISQYMPLLLHAVAATGWTRELPPELTKGPPM